MVIFERTTSFPRVLPLILALAPPPMAAPIPGVFSSCATTAQIIIRERIKINDIIKEGQECPEVFDQVATISINKYLDQNSLYLPRQIKKVKNTDLILDTQLDEQTRLMAIEKLKQNEKYTKTAIEKNVLQFYPLTNGM